MSFCPNVLEDCKRTAVVEHHIMFLTNPSSSLDEGKIIEQHGPLSSKTQKMFPERTPHSPVSGLKLWYW